MVADLPAREEERLEALLRYDILDTPRENDFDEIVQLAAEICQTSISLVSLVDRDRQWFKGRHGLEISETPRRLSFCAHAILHPRDLTVVPDATKDPRFADNELVTGDLGIRFYAGAPLVTPDGFPLGTLCVIDRKPRTLNDLQQHALRVLSRQVVIQLELRRRLRDLTRTANQLEDANAELKGVTNAISHDLRAPLRTTINFAEILALGYGEKLDERGRNLLRHLRQGGERMSEMLENYLRLLRVRHQPLLLREQDMQRLVEGVVAELKLEKPSLSARFEVNNLPSAKADAGLIRQVWVNLLSNAVKFSQDRPQPLIHVEGSREPHRIVYQVRDNGWGFDPARKDDLWKPFHRLHGAEIHGNGLGLSIVKRIVQHHGGTVWAESEPERFAAFFFALPAEHQII